MVVVVSLFDGIGVGVLALKKLGISIEEYYAYEICTDAMKVTSSHHRNVKHMGDIRHFDKSLLPDKIDILFAGSPCIGLARGGRQEGLRHVESSLFYNAVEILKQLKPSYFLFENVIMKPEWKKIFDTALGVNAISIDSKLISAQCRNRLYWTNIPRLDEIKIRSLKLTDVLEPPFTQKQPLTSKDGKSYCLTASYIETGSENGIPYANEVSRNLKRRCRTCVRVSDDDDDDWRLLTPVECERLQTLPDNYTKAAGTNKKRWKMIGNAWTLDIIKYLISSLVFNEQSFVFHI